MTILHWSREGVVRGAEWDNWQIDPSPKMNISLIHDSSADIPGGVYTGSAAGIQELSLIVFISAAIKSVGPAIQHCQF